MIGQYILVFRMPDEEQVVTFTAEPMYYFGFVGGQLHPDYDVALPLEICSRLVITKVTKSVVTLDTER
jgi:hypothetical protein